MPGNVAVAAPSTVLPKRLAGSFTEVHEYVTESCGPYVDGRWQARVLSPTAPRRTWRMSAHVNAAGVSALLTFYAARKGPLQPFYFYPDPDDWDETGESEVGRYTVRFSTPINASHDQGHHRVEFEVTEIV